jgi:hypothetical protein
MADGQRNRSADRARDDKKERPRRGKAEAALGPGLHAGHLEMVTASADEGRERGQSYRVRLASGRRVAARLGKAVAADFADECLRDGRTVVLVESPGGVEIAGALQVSKALAKDPQGTLTLEARHVRVRADQSIVLEVPGGALSLEPGGAVRLEGDKLVIDMAALVRVFAARVELP